MGASSWSARPVQRTDWTWIQRWFTDPILDRRLGPMDAEWLEHVLTETDGVELVITKDRRTVALAGVRWDRVTGINYLTDLAVDPLHRRQGIGARAIRTAMTWPGQPDAVSWVAFVAPENFDALRFFRAQDWSDEGRHGEMVRFRLPTRVEGPTSGEARFDAAWSGEAALMRSGSGLRIGDITWSRDELHER